MNEDNKIKMLHALEYLRSEARLEAKVDAKKLKKKRSIIISTPTPTPTPKIKPKISCEAVYKLLAWGEGSLDINSVKRPLIYNCGNIKTKDGYYYVDGLIELIDTLEMFPRGNKGLIDIVEIFKIEDDRLREISKKLYSKHEEYISKLKKISPPNNSQENKQKNQEASSTDNGEKIDITELEIIVNIDKEIFSTIINNKRSSPYKFEEVFGKKASKRWSMFSAIAKENGKVPKPLISTILKEPNSSNRSSLLREVNNNLIDALNLKSKPFEGDNKGGIKANFTIRESKTDEDLYRKINFAEDQREKELKELMENNGIS